MGLFSLINKIRIGFIRSKENSIPCESSIKKYGNFGEDKFVRDIQQVLPDCQIKRNVLVSSSDGNAEIDCLILYRNKLFAVEVKRWKGRIIETDDGFIQKKTDRWTGEIHEKHLNSPFRQLNRAIYFLKHQIPIKVWINAIVFFEDSEFETALISSDNLWLSDIDEMARYISCDGKSSKPSDVEKFFELCVSADLLYSRNWNKSLRCIIDKDSLKFQTSHGTVFRDIIDCIQIEHHWSYDELNIKLIDGKSFTTTMENKKIMVNENGVYREYALCKLDYIKLGR